MILYAQHINKSDRKSTNQIKHHVKHTRKNEIFTVTLTDRENVFLFLFCNRAFYYYYYSRVTKTVRSH